MWAKLNKETKCQCKPRDNKSSDFKILQILKFSFTMQAVFKITVPFHLCAA